MNITVIIPTKQRMPSNDELDARKAFEKLLKPLPSGYLTGHDAGDGTMRIFIEDAAPEWFVAVVASIVTRLNECHLLKNSMLRFS